VVTSLSCFDHNFESELRITLSRSVQAPKHKLLPPVRTYLCTAAANDYTLWDTGVGNNGHFYKHVVGNALSWANAGAAAKALTICDGAVTGHLATLTSEEEDAFVYDLLDLTGYAGNQFRQGPWLGGYQPAALSEPPYDVGWQWVTGEVWSYTNWDPPNEPNGRNEDCVQIFRPGRRLDPDEWNDDRCTGAFEYIMEFSGPTFHIGNCNTGVVDPDYDMCTCQSSAVLDLVADCTTTACVQNLLGLLSQATIDAIISSPCPFFGEGPPGGGAQGDPHFKTWKGQHFDFHGECDLILLQSKEFESGLGLDVHIRTHMRRDMSYISTAALRIGTDVLEVKSQGVYYLNGVAGADSPSEFGGFEFLHSQPTDKQHVFEVHLGGRERIKVKTYKDFVSVLFEQAELKHFGKSVGLMGDFRMGHMISRDGKTIIDDANAFGQEWQVLDSEPKLFNTVRFPQHPQMCTMPTPAQATSQLRRRLSESSVGELAAEKACEHWGKGKDDCVFDVLTTGDLEMAVVGAY
jgi:hypothetical protein